MPVQADRATDWGEESMAFLTRALKLLTGWGLCGVGYLIIAAEGWPEPLQSMILERRVIGGAILTLGLAFIWSSLFGPPVETRHAPAELADPADPGKPDPFALEPQSALQSTVQTAPAPAPAEAAAEAAAPAASAGPIGRLMAEGDRLLADGRLNEALDPYSEALDFARADHAARPGDAQAACILAAALKSNADLYDEQGRLDAAIDLYEQALKLSRGLAASGGPEDQRRLSLMLERLGDCREARGHRSRAADLYRESLALAEHLAREHPDERLYAQDLQVTRGRLEELESLTAPA
jgi:tetratricopeptide (TPR) repeat protein